MLQKTINNKIDKAIGSWIRSIKDKEVQQLARDNTIVSGGCFYSFIHDEEPNDYDIYFRTTEAALAISKYYVGIFNEVKGSNISVLTSDSYPDGTKRLNDKIRCFVKSAGVANEVEPIKGGIISRKQQEDDSKNKYRPVCITSNAISLSDKIQLITRFIGEPEDIHKNYDFDHTKAYWKSWDYTSVISSRIWELVHNKVLYYSGSLYPVCSLFRLRKFLDRGFTINAGQIFKIAYEVSKLNLDDPAVLEDQLIGVDSMYFHKVIELLSDWHKKNNNELDYGAYVMQVIDEVF